MAVDISAEKLKHNHDVDGKRLANVTDDLPFEKEKMDIVVAISVLEHLEDSDKFMINLKIILNRGAYFIHLFSSKFAPFRLLSKYCQKGCQNLYYFT